MRTIIHVNRHKIASNRRNKKREPVIAVKTYKSNDYAHEVVIDGPCRLIYNPDKPLPCGATTYITTESEVIVVR